MLQTDFYSSTVLARRKHVTVLLGTTSTAAEPQVAKIYSMKDIRESSSLQFVNEPSVLQYIRNPHILRCYGCRVNTRKDTVMLFEETGGISLQKLINEHRRTGHYFPESTIWVIAGAIISALEYLHRNDNKTFYDPVSGLNISIGSMTHGSLRPSNVFITGIKDTALSDSFNLSDVKVSHPAIYRNFGSSRSPAGTPINELIYHAPEILNALTNSSTQGLSLYETNTACCGAAPDIWSLGIILYEMLSLAKPACSDNTMHSCLDSSQPILTRHDLDISNVYSLELIDFIMQMLNPDPLHRPQLQLLLLNGQVMSVLQGSPLLSPLRRHRQIVLGSISACNDNKESKGGDTGISNLSNIEHRPLQYINQRTYSAGPTDLGLDEVIEVLNSPYNREAGADVSVDHTSPCVHGQFTNTAVHLIKSQTGSDESSTDSANNKLKFELEFESDLEYNSEVLETKFNQHHNPPKHLSEEKSQLETPSMISKASIREITQGAGVLRLGPLETITEHGVPERSLTAYVHTSKTQEELQSSSSHNRSVSVYPRKQAYLHRPANRSAEVVPLLISNTPSNGSFSKYSYRNPDDPLIYKQIYVRGARPSNKSAATGMHAELSHTIFGLSPHNYVSFDVGRSTSRQSRSITTHSGEHEDAYINKSTTFHDSGHSNQSGTTRGTIYQARDGPNEHKSLDRKMISWRSKADAIANAHLVKRDKKGNTQLMLMALSNNVKAVHEYLYQAGLQNKFGYTAMMIAAKRGFVEIVKLLMNQESGITTKRKCATPSVTALILASMAGQAEIVYLLHEKEKCIQDKSGMTALMHAAIRGYTDIVLILRSAEARKRDFHGCTALFFATECNRLDIMKLLIEQEAQMSTTDGYKYGSGFTALMCAARLGFVQAVELLIKSEANMMHMPADRESGGFTALVWAAREGHLACVKALAPYEAAISGSLAITEGEKSIINSKVKKQKIRMLIRRHMNVDEIDDSAVNRGSSRILRTCDI